MVLLLRQTIQVEIDGFMKQNGLIKIYFLKLTVEVHDSGPYFNILRRLKVGSNYYQRYFGKMQPSVDRTLKIGVVMLMERSISSTLLLLLMVMVQSAGNCKPN